MVRIKFWLFAVHISLSALASNGDNADVNVDKNCELSPFSQCPTENPSECIDGSKSFFVLQTRKIIQEASGLGLPCPQVLSKVHECVEACTIDDPREPIEATMGNGSSTQSKIVISVLLNKQEQQEEIQLDDCSQLLNLKGQGSNNNRLYENMQNQLFDNNDDQDKRDYSYPSENQSSSQNSGYSKINSSLPSQFPVPMDFQAELEKK
eukprot:Awhi_evm1s8238